jgi:hypothetical protein
MTLVESIVAELIHGTTLKVFEKEPRVHEAAN